MTNNVVDFTGVTRLDLDPDRILKNATGYLSEVVILGFTKDGEEYFASSKASGADVLWHLERAKKKLLEMVD